jgi:hypothetical protein
MYPLYKEYDRGSSVYEKEALKGIISENEITHIFFSQKNIDALQEGIRYQVYVRSGNNHVIDNQSVTDIKIIMTSVYLEYSKNMPFQILEQVRELNGKVLEFCVDKILSEINMYLHYIKDISKLPEPLDRSTSTSSAGTKTLEMKEF